MTIETHSADETFALGKRLGEAASPGTLITLDGDLGAGKTVLAKGVAAGLGVSEIVTSPTFTIMQGYESGRLPLYHFDVYRIADPEEMEELGFRDFFFGDGVCLVEWAEQIEELIPAEAARIVISRGDASSDHRLVVISLPSDGTLQL